MSAEAETDDVAALLETTASDEAIELLVLFGSAARGDQREDSDIDLIVDGPVTHDFAAWTRLRGQLLERLTDR